MKPGERLDDRFELESRIASGGTAEVFRARDPSSGEVVAVKILPGQPGAHAERFAREIRVLAELSHPGIVRYLSHGATSAGEPFLVMEWLDGESLQARLARGPLPVTDAVALATRVAGALGAAHARGIVHRNLKPSNLFLPGGRADQVKVLDFGIAQPHSYMAPEQARSGCAVDARADVFALGCVLSHGLTGVPPFEGDTTAAVLAKILLGAPRRVRELWPEVSEDLDALVARMLAHEPSLRPSDGASLAAALAALGPPGHGMASVIAPVIASVPASVPREHAPRSLAFHGGERRLCAVVMLGSLGRDDHDMEASLRRTARFHGGRIEQLADGSMVVVLASDQVATDHAARAARCVLMMRATATRRPVAIAMGRSDAPGTLPGADVIDRAARLLSHAEAPPGGLPPIVLDEMSAGLLDARFDVVERQGQLVLRGERALVHNARTLLGRPTSCVGRDWELGVLTAICDECVEEHQARVALVIAAAGMGKSRLGAELVSRVRDRHPELAIWVGRGDSLRAGSTLDLLAQALRSALGTVEGEPLAERRDKIRARVAEHVPPGDRRSRVAGGGDLPREIDRRSRVAGGGDLPREIDQRRVAAFLGELVGPPFPADDEAGAALAAARQDAQLMSEQMRRAWLDFLRAEASAHPVLVLLDDLHWGDIATVRFIDTALRDRGDLPWMVLALARPEVFETLPNLWSERSNVQAIRLEALGKKASERLIRQVLGDRVGPGTVARLVEQAGGNAFYLEELIRAVAEGKAEGKTEGKDAALPETVLAMVEARLARLPLEAQRVLRAASVFGEACWEGGATALLAGAMPAADLAEWLAYLVEHEVLAVRPDTRFPGERELAFRHALLREGAYATLTDGDRRLGHHRAGEWLEQHGETNPMVLAGHFEIGGDGARAVRHYVRAAQQAIHVLDPEAALARTALGLACDPPPELRIALLGLRCEACQATQQVPLDEARELLRLAPRGSVPWAQGMLACNLGKLLAGRIEELLGSIEQLHDITPSPGAAGAISLTMLSSILILDMFGRVPQGTALENAFLAIVRARGDQEPLARVWWHNTAATRASYAHDDPWAGLQHSAAIQEIFDAIGGEIISVSMQLRRGMNQWYLGALAPAAQSLEDIPVADSALGIASSLRRFLLSWVYADRGALDRAHALATELAGSGRAHKNRLEEARGRWVLAEVLRRMGDLAAADREAQVAREMALPLEQPGALTTLSALRLAQGRAEEALAAAEAATARATAMGGCGLFRGAFMRLAHAEALHATGGHDAARASIAQARAYLLAVADKIADPGYRTSFLEQVPENARTLALARAWLGEAAPAAPAGS